MFRERPQILFHQSPVDCYVPPQAGIVDGNEDLVAPTNQAEVLALSACKRAIELKQSVGTLADRTYDAAKPVTDDHVLSDKRRGTFLLAQDIAKKTAKSGKTVSWYSLADVSSFVTHTDSIEDMPTVRARHGQADVLIRLEESLAVQAERLTGAVKAKYGSAETGKYTIDDGQLVVHRRDNSKTIPLHGYLFNRSGSVASQPTEALPDLPSCEAFIAATVLDQTRLSPAIVRVVPYWMRDRESAARDILQSLGYDDLPVLSVISGKSGDVEKILPWSNSLPSQLHDVKPLIKERVAHQASKQVTKTIHDRIQKEQGDLYRTYNRPELESNISPPALLDYPYLSQRVHEFLSRTLVAATLYESGPIKAEGQEGAFHDTLALIELMNRNYQSAPLPYNLGDYRLRRHDGINTNDVTELSVVLGGRPEEDSVLMPHSKQINLVGHFVFEQLPASIIRQYHAGTAAGKLLLWHFMQHPPRSVLMEARRVGPNLKSFN